MRNIMQNLALWKCRCFSVGETCELYPASADTDEYDGNFVALPVEKLGKFKAFIA